MTDDIWENALTLLAIIVLADDRVRDPEMVEFCHEAQLVNQALSPDRIITDGHMRRWFAAHKENIRKALHTDKDAFIINCLGVISEPDLRKIILQGMFAISICDYEMHDEENEILKTVIQAWQLQFDPNTAASDARV